MRSLSLLLSLRTAALLLVAWALLGPTQLHVRPTTSHETVILIADASGSMNVVDNVVDSLAARWRLVASKAPLGEAIRSFDSGVIALRSAQRSLQRAQIALEDASQSTSAVDEIENACARLNRAAELVTIGKRNLPPATFDLMPRAGEVVQEVSSIAAASESEWRQAAAGQESAPIRAHGLPSTSDDVLVDFIDQLRLVARRADAFCDTLARRAALTPESGPPATRLEQVASLLDRLESNALKQRGREVRFERLVVTDGVRTLGEAENWSAAVRRAVSRPSDVIAQDDSDENVGSSTNLTAAITAAAGRHGAESIAATILLSDGRHNTLGVSSPETAALNLGTPVHVVPIGAASRDLVVSRFDAPTVVARGDKILFRVLVTATACAGERTEVLLRRDGQPFARREVVFESDWQIGETQFAVAADTLGNHDFMIEVNAIDNELGEANNRASTRVRVVNARTSVLLADHAPRWETRYLAQLFARDPHVDLNQYMVEPVPQATGLLAATGELPTTPDEWARFQVIILGDFSPAEISDAQLAGLDRFVRVGGGTLVVIAGERAMPHAFPNGILSNLLPVEREAATVSDLLGRHIGATPEAFRSELMQIGDSPTASAELWRRQFAFAPIQWLSPVCVPKPAAHNLLVVNGADDSPIGRSPGLLTWRQAGAGKVVYLAAPATYRLRFREGDRLHHRFWGNLLRWASSPGRSGGDHRIFVDTDNVQYPSGSEVEVTVYLADATGRPAMAADVYAIASSGDGPTQRIPLKLDSDVPGRYAGAPFVLAPGTYQITAGGPTVDSIRKASDAVSEPTITVFEDARREMRDTRGDFALLQRIADASGGLVVPPTALEELLLGLPRHSEAIQVVRRETLWNTWPVLLGIIGCLSCEWVIRRRVGLV